MSSISSTSSTSSSYSLTSTWEKLNSSSKTVGTTAKSFSVSISKSNLNSKLVSQFDSSNNSKNSFHGVLSKCNALKNGTVKTNISKLVENSSSIITSSIDTLV
jgi:hypothetical protein